MPTPQAQLERSAGPSGANEMTTAAAAESVSALQSLRGGGGGGGERNRSEVHHPECLGSTPSGRWGEPLTAGRVG